jgi:hypothetical protein
MRLRMSTETEDPIKALAGIWNNGRHIYMLYGTVRFPYVLCPPSAVQQVEKSEKFGCYSGEMIFISSETPDRWRRFAAVHLFVRSRPEGKKPDMLQSYAYGVEKELAYAQSILSPEMYAEYIAWREKVSGPDFKAAYALFTGTPFNAEEPEPEEEHVEDSKHNAEPEEDDMAKDKGKDDEPHGNVEHKYTVYVEPHQAAALLDLQDEKTVLLAKRIGFNFYKSFREADFIKTKGNRRSTVVSPNMPVLEVTRFVACGRKPVRRIEDAKPGAMIPRGQWITDLEAIAGNTPSKKPAAAPAREAQPKKAAATETGETVTVDLQCAIRPAEALELVRHHEGVVKTNSRMLGPTFYNALTERKLLKVQGSGVKAVMTLDPNALSHVQFVLDAKPTKRFRILTNAQAYQASPGQWLEDLKAIAAKAQKPAAKANKDPKPKRNEPATGSTVMVKYHCAIKRQEAATLLQALDGGINPSNRNLRKALFVALRAYGGLVLGEPKGPKTINTLDRGVLQQTSFVRAEGIMSETRVREEPPHEEAADKWLKDLQAIAGKAKPAAPAASSEKKPSDKKPAAKAAAPAEATGFVSVKLRPKEAMTLLKLHKGECKHAWQELGRKLFSVLRSLGILTVSKNSGKVTSKTELCAEVARRTRFLRSTFSRWVPDRVLPVEPFTAGDDQWLAGQNPKPGTATPAAKPKSSGNPPAAPKPADRKPAAAVEVPVLMYVKGETKMDTLRNAIAAELKGDATLEEIRAYTQDEAALEKLAEAADRLVGSAQELVEVDQQIKDARELIKQAEERQKSLLQQVQSDPTAATLKQLGARVKSVIVANRGLADFAKNVT